MLLNIEHLRRRHHKEMFGKTRVMKRSNGMLIYFYDSSSRDTAAKTECVALESAGSENLQAGEYEVPMKQCAAYGVIRSTPRDPENYMNPAPVYESVS